MQNPTELQQNPHENRTHSHLISVNPDAMVVHGGGSTDLQMDNRSVEAHRVNIQTVM